MRASSFSESEKEDSRAHAQATCEMIPRLIQAGPRARSRLRDSPGHASSCAVPPRQLHALLQPKAMGLPQCLLPHIACALTQRTLTSVTSFTFSTLFTTWPISSTISGSTPSSMPGKYGFSGVPDYSENCNCNKKPYQRVRKRITQPDPKRPEKHGKARKTIYSRMVTISHQSRTSDFYSYFNPELCNYLVSQKPDNRSCNYTSEKLYWLREEKPGNRLISRNSCTKKD